MGNKTKIQCSESRGREQWHVRVPSTLAEALELEPGEEVEWLIVDQDTLVLRRSLYIFPADKKKTTSLTGLF